MNAPPEKPWSMRRRLTVRVLALVMGGWLATILLSELALDHEMREMFDEELSALVETTVLYLDAAQGPSIPRSIGVGTSDGERVLRIVPQDVPAPAAPWPALTEDGFHDAPGWRILRRSAEGAVIEAAHAISWRREEMLEASQAFLAMVLPLVVLLLWGLGRTVSDTTAPVAALARTVARRAPDDLSPVGAAGLPLELRPLAEALDTHLLRIEALRRSERDFVANAAHELRTPLAAVRARLDLSSDPDARAALEQVDALTRRVERLLQLGRLEAGVGLGRGPCDLLRVLRLLLEELRPTSRHPFRLDDSDLESLMVGADADAVAILLRNLLENAAEHGSGEVRVTLFPDGRLRIENPADITALPEGRFAHRAGSGGQGLGLSIIEAMAQALDLSLAREAGGGRVLVDLTFRPIGG